jgi:hypothetical protein
MAFLHHSIMRRFVALLQTHGDQNELLQRF